MKRILFALTIMAGLLLPLAPRAQAGADVSLNLFYDNLSTQGNWIEVADYGYCFQPNVASGNANWRPYADGYWAYTDVGWTWVSYEDFGWATYHYGRWSRLSDYGWVWVPGYEWAPAWVSWRTGGDYVGWAPLPASANQVYEGRAITGQVDVEFDIGPQYYNFVDVRYIGEPVLRERIFEPGRNVTIISSTVNVTNITYSNSTVYNYGPDYNRLNQYSTRPIQRLSLQRETTVGANLTAQGGGRNFNRVNGNQFVVVAPAIQKSQQQIAPKQVKAKVQQPKFEHGWQGVSNQQQLQAEMKKENPKNVPPPTFQPQQNRKAEAAAGQNAAPQPNEAAPASENKQPVEGAVHQDQRNRQGQNAGAEAGQGNGNANNVQADQPDKRSERRAARKQKARVSEQEGAKAQTEQQQAERGQTDQRQKAQQAEQQQASGQEEKTQQAEQQRGSAQQAEQRKARQEKRAQRVKTRPVDEQPASRPQDTEKPERPNAKHADSVEQGQESQRAEQAAQPAEQAGQATRPEGAQPPRQRRQRANRPEQAKEQNNPSPNAPRKAKKTGQPEETPAQTPAQPQP